MRDSKFFISKGNFQTEVANSSNELTRKNSKNSFVSGTSTQDEDDDEYDDDDEFPQFDPELQEGQTTITIMIN